MKQLAIAVAALLVCGSANAQQAAWKSGNGGNWITNAQAPAVWKVTRTGNIDVPHVNVDNATITASLSGLTLGAGTALVGKVGIDQTTPGTTNNVTTVPKQLGSGTADVIMKATSAGTGTNWTAFGSQSCSILTVVNTTGTTMSVRIGGAGQTLELPDGSGQTFTVAANANEVGIKRTDDSNTQVDVKAVASK